MRRQLVLAAVAVTATIVLAFCIPLARLVRDVARDRAIAEAERDAERVAGALAVTDERTRLVDVVESTEAGSDDRLGIVLPDGSRIGTTGRLGDEVDLARASTSAFAVDAGEGLLWMTPVDLTDGVAVVRIVVPGSDVTAGVAAAWGVLAAVAGALLVAGVVVSDRFGQSVTRPAVALADAAERVATGDLAARVVPAGPRELVRAAEGFNDLAGRVTTLVAAERESVADLAHRLRTPLAAMRLDAEAATGAAERDRLLGDVDALEQAVDTVIREARRPERHASTPVGDLAAVARARTEFWSALADDQGRPWTLEVPEGAFPVPAPPGDLEAMLDALLDNVFSHTEPGTPFSVAVAVAPERGGLVRLVVRDAGPGFGPADPTARGRSGSGGTGLGLDIARRAAEAAGGSLRIHDDRGAVVTIELPLIARDAPVPPAARRRHRVGT